MNSVTILKLMVWYHMKNQNYHLMNKFLKIDLMLGLSRALVDRFISYLQVEGGTRWKITSKNVFLLDIQPPPLRYIIGIWTLKW